MAYVIGGGCIMCGSCAGECPVGAIAEGDGKYEINADACVDCGTCAGSCPVGAISGLILRCEENPIPFGTDFLPCRKAFAFSDHGCSALPNTNVRKFPFGNFLPLEWKTEAHVLGCSH